jgi:hypothetical protein
MSEIQIWQQLRFVRVRHGLSIPRDGIAPDQLKFLFGLLYTFPQINSETGAAVR